MNTNLRELNVDYIEEIKVFFFSIFTKEPWNDDWSDKNQLHAYINDLISNNNSLALGLFENENSWTFTGKYQTLVFRYRVLC